MCRQWVPRTQKPTEEGSARSLGREEGQVNAFTELLNTPPWLWAPEGQGKG